MGPSFYYPGRSVDELILQGLPITAELGLYALLIAVIIGSFAGVIAALKPNTMQDYVPMSIAMVGICMPSFLLGPVLVLVFGIMSGLAAGLRLGGFLRGQGFTQYHARSNVCCLYCPS